MEKRKNSILSGLSTRHKMMFLATIATCGFIFLLTVIPTPDFRSPREKIESQFNITLPTNARNIQYWRLANWYELLVRFTIDSTDIDRTIPTVEWKHDFCINTIRETGYMPDFYVRDSLEWWNPQDAEVYEGVSCLYPDENYYGRNMHIMVDLTNPNEATIYIEQFATSYGERKQAD